MKDLLELEADLGCVSNLLKVMMNQIGKNCRVKL